MGNGAGFTLKAVDSTLKLKVVLFEVLGSRLALWMLSGKFLSLSAF